MNNIEVLDNRITEIANAFYLKPDVKNELRMIILDVALWCTETSKQDQRFEEGMKRLYRHYKEFGRSYDERTSK